MHSEFNKKVSYVRYQKKNLAQGLSDLCFSWIWMNFPFAVCVYSVRLAMESVEFTMKSVSLKNHFHIGVWFARKGLAVQINEKRARKIGFHTFLLSACFSTFGLFALFLATSRKQKTDKWKSLFPLVCFRRTLIGNNNKDAWII